MENNKVQEWGFALAWNKALEQVEDRPMKERSHLWASELGKSPVDLWLKLRGTPLTNPPNARSLRKFEAGNVFEWIVSLVLKRAGILKESQKWMSWQYPGLVEVTGKADFIAGGRAKKDAALEDISQLGLPNVFIKGGTQILEYLESLGDLEEMPLEVKSVSSFMFESLEKNQSATKIHRLQLTHYLKAMGYKKGRIVYICRDDLRMMEFVVYLEIAEPEYKEVITNMTNVLQSGVRPDLEKRIVFDEDLGKFAKNFNVAYSGYLTMLYGFKDQKEFDDIHTPVVARWNRVMARVKNGDKMTAKNMEVLAEMRLGGFEPNELVDKFVGGAVEEEVPA